MGWKDRVSAAALAGLLWAGCDVEDAPSVDASMLDGAVDPSPDAGPGDDAALADAGRALRGFSLSDPAPCASGSSQRCATLTVPRDWDDPAGPTITRPVRIAPATDAAARRGVLLWNPGGPGAATHPSQASLATAVPALRAAFDLVSIDWRGVGSSDPQLRCPRPAARDELGAVLAAGNLEDAIAEAVRLSVEASETCLVDLDPVLVAHAGSEDMARDFEALRIALGESQLSYVGYSYGTMLGATYASLYPDRVRAFVLDSPVNPGEDEITGRHAQIVAQEAGLVRWTVWCAGEPGCAFARGRDAEAVRAAILGVVERYRTRPRRVARPEGGTAIFDAAAVTSVVVGRVIRTSEWGALGIALAQLEDGDLLPLVRSMTSSDTMDLSGLVIRAVDQPMPPWADAESIVELVRARILPEAPLSGLFAALWLAERSAMPAYDRYPVVHAPSAPPMLVIANVGDTQTPYADAAGMLAALDNGSHLLTYEGPGHAQAHSIPCLRDAAAAFLLDPSTPPAIERCAAVEITP